MVKDIKENEFNDLMQEKDKLIIIDCFAQWCMPCKMFAPILENISEENPDVVFAKLDIDENEEVVTKYSIEAVPTILFIKNGNVINQEIGVRSQSEMIELINKYKDK